MSKLNKKDLSIKEENKENFKDSVIERKNLTNEFTVADIEKHVAHLNKMKKEADATVGVAKATKANIEDNHGELLGGLGDKERHHVWMWQEQDNILKEVIPQQEQIDAEIEKHEEYLDVIYDAFGFVKSELNDTEEA